MAQVNAELWKHQINLHNFAIKTFKEHGHCFWLAGCATGKTLSAYKVIETMHNAGFKKFLVITTKGAITSAWVEDAEKFLEGIEVVPLIKGSSRDKAKLMLSKKDSDGLIIVVNYKTARLIAPEIRHMGFSLAIADESQRLKTYNSKQSLELAEACYEIPYKLCMTATAWDDKPTDIYGQYRWLSPVLHAGNKLHDSTYFGHYHNDFYPMYVNFRMLDNHPIPISYKNQDKLMATIQDTIIKIETEKVRDLPPYRVVERVVELNSKTQKIYDELLKESLVYVQDDVIEAPNPLVLSLRLHQVASGFYTPTDGDDPVAIKGETAKLDALADIVESIGGEPFVVFTRFTHDVNRIQEFLQKQGYDVKLLVGGTHEHNEFQRGEGDCLIANMSAGSEGVNLDRANYAIYYSVGHSRVEFEQSRWRIRRKEGDTPIVYYRLIAKGTIDKEIYNSLESKGDMSDRMKLAIKESAHESH